jgi:hypothetical protein
VIRLSPSQFKSFEACKRLWGWQKIAGIPSIAGAGATLGSEVHSQIENLLKGGSLDFTRDSGSIAASALEFIPAPTTPGLHTEREFFFEGDNAVFNGRIDCELPATDTSPGVVIDWKTTSSWDWMKHERELRNDAQAVLYACHHFIDNPEAERVICRWVFMKTRGGRASRVTEITFTQQEALAGLQRLEKVAAEMSAIANAAPKEAAAIEQYILTLPPTEASCGNYGGCQFRGKCSDLSPLVGLKNYLNREKNKTMSSLLAKKPAAAAPQEINPPEQHLPVKILDAPAPVASPAAVAQPAQPPVGGSALLARVRAGVAGQALPSAGTAAVEAAMAAVAPMVAPTPEPGQLTQLGMETLAKYGVAVSSVSDTTEEMCARVNRGEPPTPFHAPAEVVQQAHAQLRAYTNENVPAEAPKGRKGRPVGSKNKPKVAPEVVPPAIVADVVAPGVIPTPPALVATGASVGNTVEVEMVTPPAEAPAPKKNLLARKPEVTSAESRTLPLPGVAPTRPTNPEHTGYHTAGDVAAEVAKYDMAKSGRTPSAAPNLSAGSPKVLKNIGILYVDCKPSTEYTDGTEISAIAKERLAAGGIHDYRAVDFGKGNALLSQTVGEVIDECEGGWDAVCLDSGLQEYGVIAFDFLIRARMVVR